MHKLKSLRNLRFAEEYTRYVSDKENLTYYKLKYASQIGNSEIEKAAMNYYENEQIKKNGSLYGLINRNTANH
jgi:hypothetical protein